MDTQVEFQNVRLGADGAAALVMAPFRSPAAHAYLPISLERSSERSHIPLVRRDAVRVENGQIVAKPHLMVPGMGYPVTFAGRHWWVEKADDDTLRYYKGPKV